MLYKKYPLTLVEGMSLGLSSRSTMFPDPKQYTLREQAPHLRSQFIAELVQNISNAIHTPTQLREFETTQKTHQVRYRRWVINMDREKLLFPNHGELATFELYQFKNNTQFASVVFEDGASITHKIPKPFFDHIVKTGKQLLDGWEFELDLSENQDNDLLESSYWDRNWDLNGTNRSTYETIHGMIADYLKHLSGCGLLPTDAVVLDAGSGKGTLLERTRGAFPEAQFPDMQFCGVELSTTSYEQALKRIQALKTNSIQLINASLTDLVALTQSRKIRPNVVIYSGVITKQVLGSYALAVQIAKQGHKSIDEGSVVIIEGLADNFLKSETYQKMGYKVLNRYHPGASRGFLVLKKDVRVVSADIDQQLSVPYPTHLDLQYNSYPLHVLLPTDAILSITSLNLAHADISSSAIRELAQTCPNTATLNLSFTEIDDPQLSAIKQAFPKLKHINLEGCEKLRSKEALMDKIHFDRLQSPFHLNLSQYKAQFPNVSFDEVLIELCDRPERIMALESLNLAGTNITKASMRYLGHFILSMDTLDVSNTMIAKDSILPLLDRVTTIEFQGTQLDTIDTWAIIGYGILKTQIRETPSVITFSELHHNPGFCQLDPGIRTTVTNILLKMIPADVIQDLDLRLGILDKQTLSLISHFPHLSDLGLNYCDSMEAIYPSSLADLAASSDWSPVVAHMPLKSISLETTTIGKSPEAVAALFGQVDALTPFGKSVTSVRIDGGSENVAALVNLLEPLNLGRQIEVSATYGQGVTVKASGEVVENDW
ncbi:MAG: hypothetical protein ACI9BD_001009 [Candidatus Marinamargulisbacteria bacterium]|jgi:hypothetical protein